MNYRKERLALEAVGVLRQCLEPLDGLDVEEHLRAVEDALYRRVGLLTLTEAPAPMVIDLREPEQPGPERPGSPQSDESATALGVAPAPEAPPRDEEPASEPVVEEEPPVVEEEPAVEKPRGVCRWADCQLPVMPRKGTHAGRLPRYCSLEHKKLAQAAATKASRERKVAATKDEAGSRGTGVRRPGGTEADAPNPPSSPVSQPTGRCGRCDEPGHYAENCKRPMVPRRARSVERLPLAHTVDVSQLEAAIKSRQGSVPDQRSHERRDHERRENERRESERRDTLEWDSVWVPPSKTGPVPLADVELGRNAMHYREMWAAGLPADRGFHYLPDVLALYGLDQELVESCLRSPERVEVRPESFDKNKRYVVLGFYRGDVLAVLGLREPSRPAVIAVYVDSRLGADGHNVNYTGGGGAKAGKGLPKTVTQMTSRLRSMGCKVEAGHVDDKVAEVFFDGVSLGKVTVDRLASKEEIQSAYQRTVRRLEGAKGR